MAQHSWGPIFRLTNLQNTFYDQSLRFKIENSHFSQCANHILSLKYFVLHFICEHSFIGNEGEDRAAESSQRGSNSTVVCRTDGTQTQGVRFWDIVFVVAHSLHSLTRPSDWIDDHHHNEKNTCKSLQGASKVHQR